MPLLKIPLLLVVLTSYLVGITPPTPPPKSIETEGYERSMKPQVKAVQNARQPLIVPLKAAVSAVLAIETLFTLADDQGYNGVLTLLCGRDAASAHAFVSPVFALGALLTCAGMLIRIACYRELGRFFTFELSILKDHQLVTTGPYALVRHPSYTGVIFISVGFTLCELAPGSWWTEARVFQSVAGKVLAATWVAILIFLTCVISRASEEDLMLKAKFGRKWESYASEVRYMFFPGIM